MWLARGNGFCHDLGKLPCAVDRPARSSRNNRSCNLFSKPFFAMAFDDLPDFLFRSLRKPLGRRFSAAGIHPHVERSVEAETEAPGCRVELGRRNAKIEQHAIHPSQISLSDHLINPAE